MATYTYKQLEQMVASQMRALQAAALSEAETAWTNLTYEDPKVFQSKVQEAILAGELWWIEQICSQPGHYAAAPFFTLFTATTAYPQTLDTAAAGGGQVVGEYAVIGNPSGKPLTRRPLSEVLDARSLIRTEALHIYAIERNQLHWYCGGTDTGIRIAAPVARRIAVWNASTVMQLPDAFFTPVVNKAIEILLGANGYRGDALQQYTNLVNRDLQLQLSDNPPKEITRPADQPA